MFYVRSQSTNSPRASYSCLILRAAGQTEIEGHINLGPLLHDRAASAADARSLLEQTADLCGVEFYESKSQSQSRGGIFPLP